MKTTVTRKLGQNRGKCRLWIEGVALSSMGWAKGTPFTAQWIRDREGRDQLVFSRLGPLPPKGPATMVGKARDRKVAGTSTRPIIDTNTDELRKLGEPGDVVHITITDNLIAVRSFDPDTDTPPQSMEDHHRTV